MLRLMRYNLGCKRIGEFVAQVVLVQGLTPNFMANSNSAMNFLNDKL